MNDFHHDRLSVVAHREADSYETMERRVALLTSANESLRQLAYDVAQDLKEPLRGIQLLCEWIGEEAPAGSPRLQELTHLLGERSRRLQLLVQGGLQVALKRASDEIVDVARLVRDTFDLLVPDEARFTLDASALPHVRTGRFALEEVFVHVLGDALRRARGPRVLVRVTATPVDGGLQLLVAIEGEAPAAHDGRDPLHEEAMKRVRRILEERGGRWAATSNDTVAVGFVWPTSR